MPCVRPVPMTSFAVSQKATPHVSGNEESVSLEDNDNVSPSLECSFANLRYGVQSKVVLDWMTGREAVQQKST